MRLYFGTQQEESEGPVHEKRNDDTRFCTTVDLETSITHAEDSNSEDHSSYSHLIPPTSSLWNLLYFASYGLTYLSSMFILYFFCFIKTMVKTLYPHQC